MKTRSMIVMSLLMSAGIALAQTAPAGDAGDPTNTTEKGLHPKVGDGVKKPAKKKVKAKTKTVDKAAMPAEPMAEPAK
jgi:hypothetical protein